MDALIVGSASKLSQDMATILADRGHDDISAVEWDRDCFDPTRIASRCRPLFGKHDVLKDGKIINFLIYSHFEAGSDRWNPLPDMLLDQVARLSGGVRSFVSIVPATTCSSMPFTPPTLNGSSGKIEKILVVGVEPIVDRPWVANPGPRRYLRREWDGRMVLIEETLAPSSRMRTPGDIYWAASRIIDWCEDDFRYKAVNIEWDPPKIRIVDGF